MTKPAVTNPTSLRKFIEGHGAPLFHDHAAPGSPSFTSDQLIGRKICKLLFSHEPVLGEIPTWTLVKNLLFKKSEEFFDGFRDGLSEILDNAHYHLTHELHKTAFKYSDDNKEPLQLKFIIDFALSIIPFTEPKDGTEIIVPQLIDGNWIQVKYKTEKIPMTSDLVGSPYYAYGCKPIDQPKAHALLLFGGTNPIPTCSGGWHTFRTDLVPMRSTGETLYNLGKKQIQDWITANATVTRSVIATGMSLGGSLSMHAHINQPDLVAVRAVNPAFLLSKAKKTYEEHTKDKSTIQPVNIVIQKRDKVSLYGTWVPPRSSLYRLSSKIADTYNILDCHKNCIAGHHATTHDLKIENITDVRKETRRISRLLFTLFMQVVSVPVYMLNIGIKYLLLIKTIISKLLYKIFTTTAQLFQKSCVENPVQFSKATSTTDLADIEAASKPDSPNLST
ncbi:MAG: hypothetical protein KBD64_00400 [Gammaproteobacteria bacterium]|nr:hypothetical protein [Gammaproteobacteria bacterium]